MLDQLTRRKQNCLGHMLRALPNQHCSKTTEEHSNQKDLEKKTVDGRF